MLKSACLRWPLVASNAASRALPTGEWGLRDYGDADQLGLEPTPEQYVANLVAVFREVRRVLRDDGTLWLNLGDSYAGAPKGNPEALSDGLTNQGRNAQQANAHRSQRSTVVSGLKPKDLVGIPWMVAFALRADGWWLRSDIVWAKPNPMPESVTDRPTRSHEYLFLLTKSARYFYDADAIREEHARLWDADNIGGSLANGSERLSDAGRNDGGRERAPEPNPAGRNKRSVWTVATQPFPGAHFATFPPKLIEPCVLAGSPPKCCGECGTPWERLTDAETTGRNAIGIPGGEWDDRGIQRHRSARRMGDSSVTTTGWKATCYHADSPAPDDTGRSLILDPFAGAGTTGVVALRHDRDFIGIELNPAYAEMARHRIRDDAPLLNWQGEA